MTEEQTTAWIETQQKQYDRMQSTVKPMNEALSNAVASAAVGVGEMLGDLITGEEFNPIQRLLEMLGKLLKDLGTALITYAGLIEAFKKTFENPYVAIAVGVAAVAAGTVFMNLAKKPIKLAQGGLAYGPTMAVVGDTQERQTTPRLWHRSRSSATTWAGRSSSSRATFSGRCAAIHCAQCSTGIT